MNPGSRLDSTLTTATLSVNVGGVHVTLFCSELVLSVMLEGQFCTVGGVTSKEKKNTETQLKIRVMLLSNFLIIEHPSTKVVFVTEKRISQTVNNIWAALAVVVTFPRKWLFIFCFSTDGVFFVKEPVER